MCVRGLCGRRQGGKEQGSSEKQEAWGDDIGPQEWLVEELQSPLPDPWWHKRKQEMKPLWLAQASVTCPHLCACGSPLLILRPGFHLG